MENGKTMLFTLTSSESKRLLAKAFAQLPQVILALQQGTVIVAHGTTNAYIIEELLQKEIEKSHYTAGIVTEGVVCTSPNETRVPPYVFVEGRVADVPWQEAIKGFSANDIFVKGANAIDTNGHAGILLGGAGGGTIGHAMGYLQAIGSQLILPVSLEKLIPSVEEAALLAGIENIDYSIGMRVGVYPVTSGYVFTELDALHAIFGVECVHIASGGIGGSEGAVTLLVRGSDQAVKDCFNFIKSIKGEPPIKEYKRSCKTCGRPCHR